MLNHITILVKDIQKSIAFYKDMLAPLGYDHIVKDKDNFDFVAAGFGIMTLDGHRDFWLKESKEAIPKDSISCIAFNALNKETVEACYQAALNAGGIDNGAPGLRTKYHPGYYAAYVLDPDGYNVEILFDAKF